ncbi:hypothetical protein D3C86_1310410 [compost metagenome]
MIYAGASWPEYIGPTVLDFDVSADFWQILEPHDGTTPFQRIPTNGVQNTGCFFLENRYDPDTTTMCYQSSGQQIKNKRDLLISPAFDLSNSTDITVSFDYAFGSAAEPDSSSASLKVSTSRDCGKTWSVRKTLSYSTLVTAYAAQGSNFIPDSTQWKQASFTYNTTVMDKRTRFKFEFSAANHSNNLYIDNFVIDGILGISGNELSGISVYPNPSKSGSTITISGLNASQSTVIVYDLQGKRVYEKMLNPEEGNVTLESRLKAGCYLVEVSQNGSKFLTRLIID